MGCQKAEWAKNDLSLHGSSHSHFLLNYFYIDFLLPLPNYFLSHIGGFISIVQRFTAQQLEDCVYLELYVIKLQYNLAH